MGRIIIIVAITFVGVFATGCERPEGGHDCKRYWYATNDEQISWTKYNSVKNVVNYFKHYKTAQEHQIDTVLIWGYPLCNEDALYYANLVDSNIPYKSFVITEIPAMSIREINIPNIYLQADTATVDMNPLRHFQNGQKIYLRAFCNTGYAREGCFSTVVGQIISIDYIE